MSRVCRCVDLYIDGMILSSIPILCLAGNEGAWRSYPLWYTGSSAVMGTLFYPVTISYTLYKLYL